MPVGPEEDSAEVTKPSTNRKSSKPRKKKNPVGLSGGDTGYGSGGSQGYVSGNSQGGSYQGFSQMTNGSSGYEEEASSFPEEDSFVALLQDQRLSDPSADAVTGKFGKDKARGRGPGSFVGVFGQQGMTGQSRMMQHHPMQSPPASQLANLSPSQQHYPMMSNGSFGSGNNGDFLGTSFNQTKNNLTASSGYCSFRSTSPKLGKPADDIDGSSVVSSSHRSNLTSSYSTFSSNSSRVSSPCSNSDPLKTYHALSPAGGLFPGGQAIGSQCGAVVGVTDGSGYLKHSLRVNNSFAQHHHHHHQPVPLQQHHHVRRHSDEISNASTRPWQYSSQSSRVSHSGSELSDDLLESLPTTNRRDSFSKSHTLPLPESMQQNLGMGMEYKNGMEFSQSQNGFMGPDSTIPLSHYDSTFTGAGTPDGPFGSQERSYSQDRVFSQDGQYSADMYVNLLQHHGSSGGSNMVVGDMESFASTFSEETEYLASILQANGQVK